MTPQPKRPRHKHGTFAIGAGQIVGALYVVPWETVVGPETAAAWAPFCASEHVQGLVFGVVSWAMYELWEVFK